MGSQDEFSDEAIEVDAADIHLYAQDEVGFDSDSEAAFLCGDYITQRYGRTMLVLEDSEWGSGRLFALPTGQVVVVQQCHIDPQLPDIVVRAGQAQPERSFAFKLEDTSLRLLVASDTGQGEVYGYMDVSAVPGEKRCDLYRFNDGLVLVLTDTAA